MYALRTENTSEHGKWFELRGISYMFSVMVQVNEVVLRKTVVGDWRFDYRSACRTEQSFSRLTLTRMITLNI